MICAHFLARDMIFFSLSSTLDQVVCGMCAQPYSRLGKGLKQGDDNHICLRNSLWENEKILEAEEGMYTK